MYKPSSIPQSASAQRAQLERERQSINSWAQEIKSTRNMHEDNLSQYVERITRLMFASKGVYDFETDLNYQYYLKMIDLCDQRLDALRVKYSRLTDLIAK